MIQEITELSMDVNQVVDLVVSSDTTILSVSSKEGQILLNLLGSKISNRTALFRLKAYRSGDSINLAEGYSLIGSTEVGVTKIMFHVFGMKIENLLKNFNN